MKLTSSVHLADTSLLLVRASYFPTAWCHILKESQKFIKCLKNPRKQVWSRSISMRKVAKWPGSLRILICNARKSYNELKPLLWWKSRIESGSSFVRSCYIWATRCPRSTTQHESLKPIRFSGLRNFLHGPRGFILYKKKLHPFL
jgi:hypothetical protein